MTNNVPVTGLAGAINSETYFQIEVPAGQTKLEISTAGGTGDCDLYVKKDAMPTVLSYDYRPFMVGTDEKVTVANPAAGTWYIMLRGYNAYSGVTLLGTYGDPGTLLVNGVPVTGINGLADSQALYRIEVPAGQATLQIQISGGTGDCDMYVKLGAAPTTMSYDYRPYLAGNEETVDVSNPTAGTWYIMLRGYSNFTNLTLKGTYGTGIVTLTDGTAVTGISGALNSEKFYKLDVPDGCSDLAFTISGGTGNCDLYVRLGDMPTTAVYDYRPYLSGNNETVAVTNPHSGTWYVMLKARSAYSGVTLLGDYAVPSTIRTLVNGVAVTGLSGAVGSDTLYQIIVPSGQSSLVIQTSGGTGDCDMYVRRDATPTLSDWDYRPYVSGNNETVTIANPVAGTYYIMLHAYVAYANLSPRGDPRRRRQRRRHADQRRAGERSVGAAGSSRYFLINVPTGQSQITFAISGGTGDADMYIRKFAKPTTTTYDYGTPIHGNTESIGISPPDAGTWYVLLYGTSAYSNVTIVATYVAAGPLATELSNGVPVTGINGALDSLKYYKIVVPSGQDYLNIATSGGTGDVDLSVKRGSLPTLASWDYNSSLPGNAEIINISHPAAGTWYILLNGYTLYADVTLTATYGVSLPTGNVFSTDPNCVAVWKLEPSALTINSLSVGLNKLTNNGVASNTTDFREGTGSAAFEGAALDNLRIVDANLSTSFPTKSTQTTAPVFSGACWVKLNSLPSTSYLMSKYMPPSSKMSWAIGVLYNGRIIFRVGYGSGASMEPMTTTSANLLQTGKWYHVAFTYNDNTKACYIRVYDKNADSVIVNETLTFTHNLSVTSAAFVLGGTESASTEYSLNGLMDEAVIFKDVLTPTEIDKIRQNTYGH